MEGYLIALLQMIPDAIAAARGLPRERETKVLKELRECISKLHFGRNGTLGVLESEGVTSLVAVYQGDTGKSVESAIKRIDDILYELDLPIRSRFLLDGIVENKMDVRNEIAIQLYHPERRNATQLIREIRKLNSMIEEVEGFLFEQISRAN